MANGTLKPKFSYIRFLNAVPNNDATYDIYIDGRLAAKGLRYKQFSEYLKAYPGFYRMQVYPSGTKESPVFDHSFAIEKDKIYTAALTLDKEQLILDLIEDTFHSDDPTLSYLRFINLSPTSDGVTISIDGIEVIPNLKHLEATLYAGFTPGTHSIEVKDTQTGKVLAVHPGIPMSPGKYYANYVVGYEDRQPSLEILIPLEGASYLKQ